MSLLEFFDTRETKKIGRRVDPFLTSNTERLF